MYQNREGGWQLIDQWEPELGQTGERVPEQFSFTLNGQLPGESKGELKQRLREEAAQVLASLFYHHEVEQGAGASMEEAARQNDLPQNPREIWEAAELDDETDPSPLA